MLTESFFFRTNKVLLEYHLQFINSMAEQHGMNNHVDIEELISLRQPVLQQLFKECGAGLINMIRHWIYGPDLQNNDKALLRHYALFVLKYTLIRFSDGVGSGRE